MDSKRVHAPAGMTLVELLIGMLVTAMVLGVLGTVLFSTSRQGQDTTFRADAQGGARLAMNLMTTELRQAGTDPSTPPAGIVAIVAGDSVSVHIRADLNGNGTIQTAEPSEDVTYRYSAGAGTLTRDPGTGPATLLDNVTDASFTYFDDTATLITPLPLSAADRARVKTIGLSVTVSENGSQPVTMTSSVNLRNR